LFAVGHFAFGYVLAKSTTQVTKTEMNIPIVLTLSVIPDIDLLVPFVEHRGPFHSIIMAAIIFTPVFALYRRKALPYFVALIQHSLIGDYIVGGVQLLWPLTQQPYGLGVSIFSLANITLEWLLFLAAAMVMLKTRDMLVFFQPHGSNMILAVPIFTVLLPTLFAFPLHVPVLLVPPHIIYLILFLTSLLIDMKKILS
jgi:membrane-bound metal-dependent hydrolase YbcI (DUF457 family)